MKKTRSKQTFIFLLSKKQLYKLIFTTLFIVLALLVNAQTNQSITPSTKKNEIVVSAKRRSATSVNILYSNGKVLIVDFYGENIFRLFEGDFTDTLKNPEATPPAQILVANPKMPVSGIKIVDQNNMISIITAKVNITIDKKTSLFKVTNLQTKALAVESLEPIDIGKASVTLTLKETPGEYFYGGGVQNGRFSHKGTAISIENQNSWTDGGVASPTPFYWSSNGYGVMFYTFKKGEYDFGSKKTGVVKLTHDTNYLDVFVMIDDKPAALLADYYQLTGNPILLPKFAFYEGHLNAYNRDFWKQDTTGILFEDGKRYKESQKDNGGIKESLNGEKNNYQFSARAVIDRYKAHDLPLGWILPNDGYGAGYGQTETLDGNIQNLKMFGEYARKNGVQIGLWTQSDLHPKAGVSALLQRDIAKEVGDAGVRVLKTDVAWVGDGYSFGLNGVSDAAHIIPQYGNGARPFIISLDGWAGTQRYAAVWTGDQTGGFWEYIRFHIPTYIGAGLSGQPNITSDMDGIFGGKNPIINARDFEWKAFTPMQLNMDGWGANEKYPYALGEPTTSINRTYLKLKSELLPYTYSIAQQALNGLPIIRAMFLDYPNPYTLGKASQYQFLYGPYFLIAPIYQATRSDEKGNDIRNNIYLPPGIWIDYFTGEKYQGDRVINNFNAPIWKLPVFVKSGAIIPMNNPNNNVKQIDTSLRIYEFYPAGKTSFVSYDDDGVSEEYKKGKNTFTPIEVEVKNNNHVSITIHQTHGSFNGFVKKKATELRINLTQKPANVSAKIGGRVIVLSQAKSLNNFSRSVNTYYYDPAPNLNEFATKGSAFEKVRIIKNPMLLVKLQKCDITANEIALNIQGYKFQVEDRYRITSGVLTAPKQPAVTNSNAEAFTLKPTWGKVNNADYYEIAFNNVIYSTIKDTSFLFEDLKPETNYQFKIRSVNKTGYSEWAGFEAQTKANPLQFAIQGIKAETTCENQDDEGIENLFDFNEDSMWHTKWETNAVPFSIIINLNSFNQLDKLSYLPRQSGGNGTLLKGEIYYSNTKENWISAGTFEWKKNGDIKTFKFSQNITARYIKVVVTDGVGGFGSGRELYVFKVPGTESYIPGDINHDRLIDENDLVSYTNYTGLKQGDADFDGYINKGDINKNGLIDAYDISVVATQLNGGVITDDKAEPLTGKLELSTPKQNYDKGEIIELTVKGIDLHSVNALSFALPYNPAEYEFEGVNMINMKNMQNLTNDRLHTDGTKVLYPTFVNVGNNDTINGSANLFVIKLKAKAKVSFNLKATDIILVDKNLNSKTFN